MKYFCEIIILPRFKKQSPPPPPFGELRGQTLVHKTAIYEKRNADRKKEIDFLWQTGGLWEGQLGQIGFMDGNNNLGWDGMVG